MTTGIGIAGNAYRSKEAFLVRKPAVMCVAGYPALNSKGHNTLIVGAYPEWTHH